MAKRVPTMREMADALALLGFAGPAERRDHVVFVHPASDTLVILPKLRPNQSVGQARVAASRDSSRSSASAAQLTAIKGAALRMELSWM